MSLSKSAMESGFEYGAPCAEGDYPPDYADLDQEEVETAQDEE